MFKLSTDSFVNFKGILSALEVIKGWIDELRRRMSNVEIRLDNVESSGGGGITLPIDAVDVDYDNTTSGLTATDVQAAIDELAANGGSGGTDRSTVTALSISSGNVTVDYAAGDYFTLTMTEHVTSMIIDNPPAAGYGGRIFVAITNGATPYTFAFPANFAWPGNVPGVVSTDGDTRDILVAETFDGGDTWAADLRLNVRRADEVPPFEIEDVFIAGSKGFWFEFDNYAEMHTDSAGTADVTAPGDTVAHTTDLSGNAHDWLQTTGANEPTVATDGGIQCISFDGINDQLEVTLGVGDTTSTMDLFMAIKVTDGGQYLTAYGASLNFVGVGQNGSASAATLGSGSPTYYIDGVAVPGGAGTSRDQFYDAVPLNTWCVVEIRGVDMTAWPSFNVGAYGSYELQCNLAVVLCCESQDTSTTNAIRTIVGAKVGLTI